VAGLWMDELAAALGGAMLTSGARE
jgi:hypothetical protein